MIIDGHAHACGNLLTSEGILRHLDLHGVRAVVLVPGEAGSARTYWLPNFGRLFPTREVANITNAMTKVAVRLGGSARHVEEGNEIVFHISRTSPRRILQFYWVMLAAGFDLATVHSRYEDWRFKGLKVHQCWDHFDVRGEAFGALVEFAAAHDLPVFIHLDGAEQARALAEIASRKVDTTFIVGHLYGVEPFMRASYPIPNVYFDISCPDVVSDARLARAIGHFGGRRLLLGSDTPYGRDGLGRSIRRIRSLNVSADDKEQMLGGTLARLLRLEADVT